MMRKISVSGSFLTACRKEIVLSSPLAERRPELVSLTLAAYRPLPFRGGLFVWLSALPQAVPKSFLFRSVARGGADKYIMYHLFIFININMFCRDHIMYNMCVYIYIYIERERLNTTICKHKPVVIITICLINIKMLSVVNASRPEGPRQPQTDALVLKVRYELLLLLLSVLLLVLLLLVLLSLLLLVLLLLLVVVVVVIKPMTDTPVRKQADSALRAPVLLSLLRSASDLSKCQVGNTCNACCGHLSLSLSLSLSLPL